MNKRQKTQPSYISNHICFLVVCFSFFSPTDRRNHQKNHNCWVHTQTFQQTAGWAPRCFPRNVESFFRLNCACVTSHSSLWHAWFLTNCYLCMHLSFCDKYAEIHVFLKHLPIQRVQRAFVAYSLTCAPRSNAAPRQPALSALELERCYTLTSV